MCSLVDRLGLLLFACLQGGLAQIKKYVPASPIIRPEQLEGGTIMGHRLFGNGGLQCLCSSTKRILYSPHLVTTVYEVEGKIGELVHAHGVHLLIVRFKQVPNELMKMPTSRGTHLGVKALTDFVVAEEKASLLVSSNEPCSCCFEETLLNSFDLLLFRQGEQ